MKIADDFAAIAKAQKALETKPEPKVDVMEPLYDEMHRLASGHTGPLPDAIYQAAQGSNAGWFGSFVPHDPVVPPCDSGE